MLSAVYMLRSGDNPELRYSLRSLANLPHLDVLSAGPGPDWLRARRIPVSQAGGSKTAVTRRGMDAIVSSRETTDPFIHLNDDFYVLEPGPLPPALHRGPIRAVVDAYSRQGLTPARSRWLAGMLDTAELLERRGIREPLCFELHVPLVVDKATMRRALATGSRYFRSVYGNLTDEPLGYLDDDVKLHADPAYDPTTLPELGRWLSTADDSLHRAEPLLARLFPNPSVYEG